MLLPKRVKYRRVHRGRLTGKALRGNKVTYGDFGLQAMEPAWITSRQIEAARIAMTQLENPMRISAVKNDIARVKTVIRANELSKNA